MIKLQVIGRLGADAEVKNINGAYVISFRMAHTERFRDSSGTFRENTIWIQCDMWRKSVEGTNVAQYLTKGKLVYVEGRPSVRGYLNQAGIPSGALNLRVDRLELLGGSPSSDISDSGDEQYNQPRYKVSDVKPSPFGSPYHEDQEDSFSKDHDIDLNYTPPLGEEEEAEDELPF